MSFDRRLTLIHDGVAARVLEGVVPAQSYVDPTAQQVSAPAAPLRRHPQGDGGDGSVDELGDRGRGDHEELLELVGVAGEVEADLHPGAPGDVLAGAVGVETHLVETAPHQVAGDVELDRAGVRRHRVPRRADVGGRPGEEVVEVRPADRVGQGRVGGDLRRRGSREGGLVDRADPLLRRGHRDLGSASDQLARASRRVVPGHRTRIGPPSVQTAPPLNNRGVFRPARAPPRNRTMDP